MYKRMLFAGMILMVLSCIEEPPDSQLTLQKEHTLPSVLTENSGMTECENLIWFINDSGNDSVIYGYDRNRNEIIRSVAVDHTTNIDWEDITQNDEYIFIGDFGNNMGNRKNLRIIKIRKTDLAGDSDTLSPAGIIYFSFEDQTDFSSPGQNQTSFDCEAFIATHDRLVLFTKDWQGYKTRLYTMPVSTGTHSARFVAQWDVESLITSAAWSAETGKLYLMGYMLTPIMWIFNDFDPENATFTDSSKTTFTNLGVQTEGILITTSGAILISSESQSDDAALYSLRNNTN